MEPRPTLPREVADYIVAAVLDNMAPAFTRPPWSAELAAAEINAASGPEVYAVHGESVATAAALDGDGCEHPLPVNAGATP